MKIMKMLRGLLKDESQAYKVGDAVEHYWNEISGIAKQNANKSEMFTSLYDAPPTS